MSLSRLAIVFFALSPFAFGASKEIMELQRDVALLQDQVRNLQSTLDQKVAAIQALTQQTLDSVNRTNTAVAIMQSSFNDTMKQQQQSLTGPVANVGQKLDAMSDDFRAVRESVLDMNTRMGKLDAKIADLENLINTVRAPAAPPPPAGGTGQPGDPNSSLAPGADLLASRCCGRGACGRFQAGTLYTSAYQRPVGREIRYRFSGVQRLSEVFQQHGPRAERTVYHCRHLLSESGLHQRSDGLRRRAREIRQQPQDPRRALPESNVPGQTRQERFGGA